MFSLENRTAVITGGNRGLGKAIAMALAKAGANIAIVGRNEEKNQEVVQEIQQLGRKAICFSTDLRDISAINQMMGEVVNEFEKLDILVNNAGVSHTQRALDLNEEDWDKVLDLNVKSTFFCCQAAAKAMKKQGHGKIINIASVLGVVGEAGVAPYAASKGAVINLTRTLALEWVKYGIRVNAIGPAYIETDMNRKELSNPKVREHLVSKTPMKRLGDPDELAGAAIFLASDASKFMTGQTVYIDGGWLAQ